MMTQQLISQGRSQKGSKVGGRIKVKFETFGLVGTTIRSYRWQRINL